MPRSTIGVVIMIMVATTLAAGVARARDAHDMMTGRESSYPDFELASPASDDARESRIFPETGYTVSGRFLDFWQRNGGLAIFGYPISEEGEENGRRVQYFERQRFELHPENRPPYDVLLGRLGDELLGRRGIEWQALPPAEPIAGCLYIAATQHNICDQADGIGFRTYWERRGQITAAPGADSVGSLALFGYPLTEAYLETTPAGDTVLTQWFERARFEWQPENPDEFKVLLGRLGAEIRPAPVPEEQPSDELVQRSREALARYLRIDPARLTLQRADAEEWPSSALGCPTPDQAYLQVITPGWRLIFSDGTRMYAVHTNERGSPLILCEHAQPIPLP